MIDLYVSCADISLTLVKLIKENDMQALNIFWYTEAHHKKAVEILPSEKHLDAHLYPLLLRVKIPLFSENQWWFK